MNSAKIGMQDIEFVGKRGGEVPQKMISKGRWKGNDPSRGSRTTKSAPHAKGSLLECGKRGKRGSPTGRKSCTKKEKKQRFQKPLKKKVREVSHSRSPGWERESFDFRAGRKTVRREDQFQTGKVGWEHQRRTRQNRAGRFE